mgnify:CR=1 FL=1
MDHRTRVDQAVHRWEIARVVAHLARVVTPQVVAHLERLNQAIQRPAAIPVDRIHREARAIPVREQILALVTARGVV